MLTVKQQKPCYDSYYFYYVIAVAPVKRLRDFCVIQWCFVVLSGEFATDIPRAWLLKINDLQLSKFPIFLFLRASNQVVGGSNPSGRA